ncbi:hypothetical protein P7C70_g2254, partial [Phenoliferia sp. Uapishka_3]
MLRDWGEAEDLNENTGGEEAEVPQPETANQPQPKTWELETALKFLIVTHVGPLADSIDVHKIFSPYGIVHNVSFELASKRSSKGILHKHLRTVTILFDVAADVIKAQSDWDMSAILDSDKVHIRNPGPSEGVIQQGSKEWRVIVDSTVEGHVAPERDVGLSPNSLGLDMGNSSVKPSTSLQFPRPHNNTWSTSPSTTSPLLHASPPRVLPQPLTSPANSAYLRKSLPSSTSLQLHSPPLQYAVANGRKNLLSSKLFVPKSLDQSFGTRKACLSNAIPPLSPPASPKRTLQPQAGVLIPLVGRPSFVLKSPLVRPKPPLDTSSSGSSVSTDQTLGSSSVTPNLPPKRAHEALENGLSATKRLRVAEASPLSEELRSASKNSTIKQAESTGTVLPTQGPITTADSQAGREDDGKFYAAQGRRSMSTQVNPPVTPTDPSVNAKGEDSPSILSDSSETTSSASSTLTTSSALLEPTLLRFLRSISPSLESHCQLFLRSGLIDTERLMDLMVMNDQDLQDLVAFWRTSVEGTGDH